MGQSMSNWTKKMKKWKSPSPILMKLGTIDVLYVSMKWPNFEVAVTSRGLSSSVSIFGLEAIKPNFRRLMKLDTIDVLYGSMKWPNFEVAVTSGTSVAACQFSASRLSSPTFGGCIFHVFQDILKIPTPSTSQLQGLQFCFYNLFDPRPFKFRPFSSNFWPRLSQNMYTSIFVILLHKKVPDV